MLMLKICCFYKPKNGESSLNVISVDFKLNGEFPS